MGEPKEGNKVFTCLNPECGKESCRLCQEISHIPLRCEEVKKYFYKYLRDFYVYLLSIEQLSN